ncbi:MAG: polyamine ABC transporter substrate-binding protein [Planctomycetes bacterium RBG_19FT_COMBO_48_8]|nr:MAG: polyamine ABC transporter substrate-binding protein [Planctomycetes bacterium RBG_19FT_COMBO_48_8]
MAILLISGCREKKDRLHIFIWSEYLDPTVVADFEKQFDCDVIIDYYEDTDSMLAKMAAGGDSIFDIVVPSNADIPILIHRGFLSPIHREQIPNLKNIDPQFEKTTCNPGYRYGVPYQWGTTGLYVRKAKNQTIDETWGLIFDPEKQPGPFILLEDMRTCFGAALKYKGYSMNTTNPKELSEVSDLLIDAKKRSLGFEGTIGCRNRVLSNAATMAIVYSGDAVRGILQDSETYYFLPCEGGIIWHDILSIPAKAPHPELAERFLNFILDPKIGARIANYTQMATPNKASMAFINPADRDNTAIYPPSEIVSRLEYINDLGEYNKLYDELWTKIKSR